MKQIKKSDWFKLKSIRCDRVDILPRLKVSGILGLSIVALQQKYLWSYHY